MSTKPHVTADQWDEIRATTDPVRVRAAILGLSIETVRRIRNGQRPRPGSKAPATTSGSARSANATAGSASSSRRSTTKTASKSLTGVVSPPEAEPDVVIPARIYRLLVTIQKALLTKLGGEATLHRSDLKSAAKKTLTAGVTEGADPADEKATWHLSLTREAPPDQPMLHPPILIGEDNMPTIEKPAKIVKPARAEPAEVGDFLSTREAEKYLGVAAQTLQVATAKGKIPHERDKRGYKFYRRPDLDAWQASRPEKSLRSAAGGRKSAAARWGEAEKIAGPGELAAPSTKKKAPRVAEVAKPSAASRPASIPDETAEAAYGFDPDYRVAPGETLKEIMAERKLSDNRIAWMTGLRLGQVRAILDGVGKIDEKVAARLQHATGVSTAFWLNAEKNYRKPLPKEEK